MGYIVAQNGPMTSPEGLCWSLLFRGAQTMEASLTCLGATWRLQACMGPCHSDWFLVLVGVLAVTSLCQRDSGSPELTVLCEARLSVQSRVLGSYSIADSE